MGDNIYLGDRNGVRTPMQWSGGYNAGFSACDPEQFYLPVIANPLFGYQAVNVAAQRRFPGSLLGWMQRLIRIRKSSPAFGRGTFELLSPGNHRILAFVRAYGPDTIVAVYNLAASAQAVALDLARYDRAIPIEMFGGSLFPRVGRGEYILTLGAYDFYWFKLRWV